MSEWQPIETAPKGKVVILYYPEKVTGAYGQHTLSEMFRIDRADSTPFREPTHWQPLPEPPQR